MIVKSVYIGSIMSKKFVKRKLDLEDMFRHWFETFGKNEDVFCHRFETFGKNEDVFRHRFETFGKTITIQDKRNVLFSFVKKWPFLFSFLMLQILNSISFVMYLHSCYNFQWIVERGGWNLVLCLTIMIHEPGTGRSGLGFGWHVLKLAWLNLSKAVVGLKKIGMKIEEFGPKLSRLG